MRAFRIVVFVAVLFGVAGCAEVRPPPNTPPEENSATRPEPLDQGQSMVDSEAQARKERSIAILKAEGVPFIEHLPLIETEAESTRRTTEQVATRALALCIVAVKGEGLDQEAIEQLIIEYKLESAFTPREREFIENPNPTQHDRVQFAWRYECYWVMLWALGFVDTLERPDKICDVRRAVGVLVEHGRDGFLEKAALRSQREILDATDLIYRYHWAVVDARINNREAPAGLDGGVVMERHHALNWLIGYLNKDWDNISTDT